MSLLYDKFSANMKAMILVSEASFDVFSQVVIVNKLENYVAASFLELYEVFLGGSSNQLKI